ncbi:hypothetical protein [Hydrogenophaga sp.]|uniref:hypothetical protein n=1 Tax=Hydrogenophaga sp. TaxID=1904254 RepID=UPI00286E99E9|nr:hypothetical protein [Hydrogenophaga sp.]
MCPLTESLPTRLAAGLTVLGLLLAPMTGAAEATRADGGGHASSSLHVRIVIPPVLRVLEDSHPQQVDGSQWVEQRLVVLSNLQNGFCASLRLTDPQLSGWRLQTDEVGGITLQPQADGYRLCASRPGRYTLRLQHDFRSQRNALVWPVHTEFMVL